MTVYFRRIPLDVIEAALIDGLGYGRIFFRIMLPLALPAMFAIGVLQFIQVWDDLLVGLLFLQSPDVRPITVGLATIPSQASAGRSSTHGGLVDQRPTGGHRLPDLPALPDQRPDDGDQQVAGGN